MMSYWAEFAHTGTPGRGRDGALPEWPRWQLSGSGESPYLVFDTLAGGGLRVETRSESSRALVEEIASDAQLASAVERCAIYRELAFFGRSFDARAYAARPECGVFPLE
jgi:para-nitrobenzyl esterase